MLRSAATLLAWVVLLLTVLPCVLAAQSVAHLEPGTRVRVVVPHASAGSSAGLGGKLVVGTLRQVDSTHVVIKVDGEGEESAYGIPHGMIRRFEISRGAIAPADAAVLGARRIAPVGALAGVAFGALWAVGRNRPREFAESVPKLSVPDSALRGGLIGLVSGAVGGALISLGSTERWDELPLRDLRVDLAEQNGTVILTIRVGGH